MSHHPLSGERGSPTTRRRHVKLPADLDDRLTALCAQRSLSRSALIRSLIEAATDDDPS